MPADPVAGSGQWSARRDAAAQVEGLTEAPLDRLDVSAGRCPTCGRTLPGREGTAAARAAFLAGFPDPERLRDHMTDLSRRAADARAAKRAATT